MPIFGQFDADHGRTDNPILSNMPFARYVPKSGLQVKQEKIDRSVGEQAAEANALQDAEQRAVEAPETTYEGVEIGSVSESGDSFVGYDSNYYKRPTNPKEAIRLVKDYIIPTFGSELTFHSGDRTYKQQEKLYNQWQISIFKAMRTAVPEVVRANASRSGQNLDAKSLFKGLTKNQQAAVYSVMEGPKQVAPPGKSKHQTGEAVDIGISKYTTPSGALTPLGNKIEAELNKIGFFRPHYTKRWDPNHFEFEGTNLAAQGFPSRGTGNFEQSGGYSGLGEVAGEALFDKFNDGESVQRSNDILALRSATRDHKSALDDQASAISMQIEDKEKIEKRIARETYLHEKGAADLLVKEQEQWGKTQEYLDQKEIKVREATDKILIGLDKASDELEKMGQDPKKTFGFVDEKGKWSWSKFGVTIGATVGFLANALLTVGSKGRIPFIAWKMIDGMIDNELQSQRNAITSKYNAMNIDLTLMGKLKQAHNDEKVQLLAGKEARLKHIVDHLGALKTKAGLPANVIESLNILSHKAYSEQQATRAKLTGAIYNINYKNAGALSGIIRQEEQTQLDMIGMGLRSGQTAASAARRSLPRHELRRKRAEELMPKLREATALWIKYGRYSNFINKVLGGYAPGFLQTYNNFNSSAAKAGILRLRTLADIIGPGLIRLTGETGNMAISENLRGIRQMPLNDSYEDGFWKLRQVWGQLTLLGDEQFQSLPKESREALLRDGYSQMPGAGDLSIGSSRHMSDVWNRELAERASVNEDFDNFRQSQQEVTAEDLEADLTKSGEELEEITAD